MARSKDYKAPEQGHSKATVKAQSNGDELEQMVNKLVMDISWIEYEYHNDKMGTTDRNLELDDLKAKFIKSYEAYRKQHELDVRQKELDKLMSAKVLERAWVPELDAYYNQRTDELKAEREAL